MPPGRPAGGGGRHPAGRRQQPAAPLAGAAQADPAAVRRAGHGGGRADGVRLANALRHARLHPALRFPGRDARQRVAVPGVVVDQRLDRRAAARGEAVVGVHRGRVVAPDGQLLDVAHGHAHAVHLNVEPGGLMLMIDVDVEF